jgi:hypothetical protein
MLTFDTQSCVVRHNDRCHFVVTGSASSLVLCCRNSKMAQLVRIFLDGYHDIMDNKSGGLTLEMRLRMRSTGRDGRLITYVLCPEDGGSRLSRNVIIA